MNFLEDEIENLCCPIVIENINIDNAPLLKDYYWKSLNINQFNREILTVKELDEPKIKMCLPDMHVNEKKTTILFHIKNLTKKNELCWNIKRKKNCDCKQVLKQVNFNLYKNVYDCDHRQIVTINLNSCSIKENTTEILTMEVQYCMAGEHELIFVLNINETSIEITVSLKAYQFNLPTFIVSNEIMPVAISDVYPPIQPIWFYNSLMEVIYLTINCIDNNIKILNNNIFIPSNESSPLLVQFQPDEIKDYEFQIQIENTEEQFETIIINAKGVLNVDLLPKNLSPIYDINCLQSPLTIYPNYVSVYIKQSSYIEKIFILNNTTDFSIRFNIIRNTLEKYYDIIAKPECGLLKSKHTKLIMLSISSEGNIGLFNNINVKCLIYKYDLKYHKKIKPADGYFEYTDEGYYEKHPVDVKSRAEYYKTIIINVNINIISSFIIDKALTMTEQLELNPCRECLCVCKTNLQINNNYLDRNFIDKILWKTIFNEKFQYYVTNNKKVQPSYEELVDYLNENNIILDKPDKLTIIALLDGVLKDSITEISKNYRFIPILN